MFINFRNHTTYSLSRGAIKISDLIAKANSFAMPAIAICDSQNLFGALEFSSSCCKAGVQPIIGCEILLDFSSIILKNNNINNSQLANLDFEKNLVKMPLFALNEEGYKNLMFLVSYSYINQHSAIRPHISFELLKSKSTGLIAFSGGIEGIIAKLIDNNQDGKISEIIADFLHYFPNNFYIEISRNGYEAEARLEDKFIDIAYRYNLPLIASNDTYFLNPEIYEAQEILTAIGDGKTISDNDRMIISKEQYFQSPEAMQAKFQDLPEAIANTINLAKKCRIIAFERQPTLPKFNKLPDFSEEEELRKQSFEGLESRLLQKFTNDNIVDIDLQNSIRKQYFERLDFEISVINKMNFPGYFLIVSDFIKWAKNNKIPVGPGRGSGAGSLVAWSLQITDLDPIRFGLLFERFLNPERVSMPDFDIDFCQSRRDEVISYVEKRYNLTQSDLDNIGNVNNNSKSNFDTVNKIFVAQIITFGKLQARAVLKDVGRVLQMPYNQVDRICKLIPFNAIEAVTLDKAIAMDKDLQNAIAEDEQIQKLVDISLKLEGLNRHASTHAAGIVIGDKPLVEICALYSDDPNSMVAIGYSMKYAENAGLVKFDFLGLKTLTVIAEAVKLVKSNRNIEININNIPLDDKKTFEMLANGDSIGVFQIESSGMRAVLRQMKADKIEDIIALISLYRPGPMDNIPTYIRRKHGEEKITYPHQLLENILAETYGVIVYQEQVMEIARVLAGYSLGGADLLRRAMGKKIKEEMDKQREIFIQGAKQNNVDQQQASEIFDLVDKFAGYGFNKSHAAAYAMISYQTAYLKANFLPEFLTASMNLEIDNQEKINIFLQLAKSNNIAILPPDINYSDSHFKIEKL